MRYARWSVFVGLMSALCACGTAGTDLPEQTRLPAPANLTIQTAGLSVTLSWEPVAGASSYLVYWAQAPTVTTTSGTQSRTSAPPYVHQASEFGATLAYVVIAVDDRGVPGRPSPVVTITPSGPDPEAPQNVRAIAGDRQVTLDWDLVEGATGYQVEVVSEFGKFSVPDPVMPPFVHSSLLNCAPTSNPACAGYQYRIRGQFGNSFGPWSSAVTAVPMPATPGSPVFTDVRARIVIVKTEANPIGTPQGAVQLSWSETEHAREYRIYVKTLPDGLEQQLSASDGSPLRENRYVHMPAQFGVTYAYRVEAINDGVASPRIDEGTESGRPLPPDESLAFVPVPHTPGAVYPYVIRGFDGSSESADIQVASIEPPDSPYARDLSWTPPTGGSLMGQRLYRAPTSTSPFELIATFADLTTSTYRDEVLAPNPAPTGLAVTLQNAEVLVSWSPISPARSGYRLYWWEQDGGGALRMGSTPVLATAYRYGELQSGVRYTFAVQVEGSPAVSHSLSVP
ncbi:MAG: fibronectin type III domain-containing protein [Nitrospirota bacterium]